MMHRGNLHRAVAAVAATVLVGVLAAPRGGTDAQGAADDFGAVQADASAPLIQGGPAGRVALNGPWTLRSDGFDHGELKGWQAGTFVGSTVKVPDAANGHRVTGLDGITSFRGTVGWYSTSFNVPKDGGYVLRFESVNHKATVWLDGRLLGTHTGTYLPFEFRTKLTTGRPHTLVVRADWRGPTAMKRAGWHRTWFNFGGVNREVTIRPLAQSELSVPTLNTRLNGDGSATVDVTVHVANRSTEERVIPVVGALVRGDEKHTFEFPKLDVPPGETRVVGATVKVDKPALWSPTTPELYDLNLTVPDETAYTVKTGLRELRKSGRRLLLNGRAITLKGASLQEDALNTGDAMTGAQMDEVVNELKAIGANATRSQHPLNPAFLERLDAAGIMVWQGIGPVDAPGAWTSTTPALLAQSKRRVRENFLQAQIHPSIIVWNLANEVAGNGHKGGQAAYIDEMARELKRRDPGRLVGLDVWGAHPPTVAGPMYKNIDAVGDTNYIGWYEGTLLPRAERRAAIRDHITKFANTFSNKIVVVTEFGAEANGRNPSYQPGGFGFQSDFLRDHIDTYRQLPQLSGMLVWNIRDFAVSPAFAGGSIRKNVPDIKLIRGVNQKGLFTYGGRPKPSVAVVRRLFGG